MGRRRLARGVCVFGVAVAVWFFTIPGRASSGCYKGTRPTTRTERIFQVETLKAVKSAVPGAPAGWRVIEETEVRPPRLACVGQERLPYELVYEIHYRRAEGAGPGADARIDVQVNRRGLTLGAAAAAIAVPGASLAFTTVENPAPTIYMFLGDWSYEGSDRVPGRADAHVTTDVPYTMVQALSVRVAGEGAEALARRIKLETLSALLYR